MLSSLGDVEIVWDSQHDDDMRKIIQKKMAEGVKFFIMKPLLGSFIKIRRKINSIESLEGQRVQIKDADIEDMFSAGKISIFRNSSGETIETEGVATNVDQVIENRTVAVRQFQGG